MSVLDDLLVSGSRPVKWIDSQNIIIQALHHPRNAIGLGGPSKGGDRWDKWFDLFLEGAIAENYTWDKKKLKMEGSRCILRQEIIALATKERSKLKIYQEFLTRRSASDSSSLPSKVNSQGVNAAEVDNRAPAIEVPGISMNPNGAPKANLRPEGDLVKLHLTNPDDEPEPRKRTCLEPNARVDPVKRRFINSDDERKLWKRTCLKPPNAKVDYPPTVNLVLETHLEPSEKIKLIYAIDTPSLSQFLQKVRKRWKIPEEHGVESFDVDVGGKIFEVDPDEERDWIFVLEAIRQRGIIAVTVIIRVSKTGT